MTRTRIPSRAWPLFLVPLAVVPFTRAQTSTEDDGVPGVGEPGGPGRVLAPEEREQWLRGRKLFDHAFHRSEGLGADELNADSCRGCHQDPVLGGAGGLELNVSRFARDFGGLGPFENLPGGQAASKLRPPYVEGREEIPLLADVFEQRQTPSILGLGLLDAIPDAEILAHEDPMDLNGDGVSGVARRLMVDGIEELGRFGWKAQVPTLRDFVKDAMAGELGITTPDDARGFAMLADIDGVSDPEIDESAVDDLFFFMKELGPPKRTGSLDPDVLAGELLFDDFGCAACHIPELQGPDGPVPAYTDLLLHRLFVASFRGMSEPGANSGVYRTPPLWGIGDTAPYMHDGRAETLQDAVLAHAGEAQSARTAFILATPAERAQLLRFLEDL